MEAEREVDSDGDAETEEKEEDELEVDWKSAAYQEKIRERYRMPVDGINRFFVMSAGNIHQSHSYTRSRVHARNCVN